MTEGTPVKTTCKNCGEIIGVVKISKSEKNPEKPYIACPSCPPTKNFIKWYGQKDKKTDTKSNECSGTPAPPHTLLPDTPSLKPPPFTLPNLSLQMIMPAEIKETMDKNQSNNTSMIALLEKISFQLETMNNHFATTDSYSQSDFTH